MKDVKTLTTIDLNKLLSIISEALFYGRWDKEVKFVTGKTEENKVIVTFVDKTEVEIQLTRVKTY